jgi:malate dehydrogenase (oxaloacetate-decarboxylating)(NADP+)
MRAALAWLPPIGRTSKSKAEMHADQALSEEIRARVFPNSRLKGQANLLVLPDLDAANIAFNLVKVLADGLAVGPILIGAAQPAHVLTPSVTVPRHCQHDGGSRLLKRKGTRSAGWTAGR